MPAQKTPAQEQPLNHSVTSTGMSTLVIDNVAMSTNGTSAKLSIVMHKEVTMQTDIDKLTKKLFIRD